MKDNAELFAIVFVGLCFFTFLGGIVYDMHVRSMECMKVRGQMIRGECVFINPNPR